MKVLFTDTKYRNEFLFRIIEIKRNNALSIETQIKHGYRRDWEGHKTFSDFNAAMAYVEAA